MANFFSRRGVLQGLGALAALSAWPGGGRAWAGSRPAAMNTGPEKKRSLRVAHLTDPHIQPERNGIGGWAACLHHVQSLADRPELILTGGDHVMDAFDQKFDRASSLWKLFARTTKDENSLPIHYCLGNHDLWGWNKSRSGTTGAEAGWGSGMALDTLELKKAYHSFDRGGWHFVVLDSVRHDSDDPDGYVGGLDEEQFEWLKGDLAASKDKHTVFVTHIPILTISVLDDKVDKGGDMKISGGLLYTNWIKMRGLLDENPQVKCVLSGHMHRIDRVEFRGVTHLCNGAVSGNWWKGKHYEAAEGYAVVDLFDDGSVERTYTEFGWKPQA
ncbi:MAG TPA: metallophosphoesterase [Phycisphaerales bacterium]|nr:metallophosphoesterase [Phycisphaerales bacterium]